MLAFIAATLRLSVPLVLAALGGYFSERGGVVNVALEGMMLAGAFAAAAAAASDQPQSLVLFAGLFSAIFIAALHALLCVWMRADAMVSGLAINIFVAGLLPVLCKILFGMTGATPNLTESQRLASVAGWSPILLVTPLLWIVTTLLDRYSRFGQQLRFAGKKPAALSSQGISVEKVQTIGVLCCGAMCGLAGMYLSIDHGGTYVKNMTAGRGFVALAALIVSKWNPFYIMFTGVLFGSVEASQILWQNIDFPWGSKIPVQWLQMLPYVVTLCVLWRGSGGSPSK